MGRFLGRRADLIINFGRRDAIMNFCAKAYICIGWNYVDFLFAEMNFGFVHAEFLNRAERSRFLVRSVKKEEIRSVKKKEIRSVILNFRAGGGETLIRHSRKLVTKNLLVKLRFRRLRKL